MKKALYLLIALVFVSGCALTTIKPTKKAPKRQPEPPRPPVVQRAQEVVKPQPKKEEILPLKEEILPTKEDYYIK